MAYADILETTAEKLAHLSRPREQGGDRTALMELYEKFLVFNAAGYTERPVRRHTTEVYDFYRIVSSHYGLEDLKAEVERQMQNLGQFTRPELDMLLLTLLNHGRDLSRPCHQAPRQHMDCGGSHWPRLT